MRISLLRFSIILSTITFLFFHYGFFAFVFQNSNYASLGGVLLILSLVICMLIANAFVYFLFLFISRRVGKLLIAITFILNAVATYFVNTYNIIVDESMIGNVINTNSEESFSFFSFKFVLYILFLGLLPAIYTLSVKINKPSKKKFFISIASSLLFLLVMAFANATNWLWIDKNSKQLGGLAMPWSYSVNTALYYIHQNQKNKEEILLPKASINNNEKSVVVLIIGESARRQNFSLYGYSKETNPLLKKQTGISIFETNSCATYTTAGVKCILEHEETSKLYEILPNYLYRNGVDVIWRTTNSGEPPLHIQNYKTAEKLKNNCIGEGCNYDEVLLSGLKEEILNSKKEKILIVLHTSTSHGPQYNKKYPKQFEKFTPVCSSVELSNCTQQELINAYDNTILYTDFLISQVINQLSQLTEYKSAMLYISDHGESLGEKNLYMHGLPINLAPREQYEVPFIVWTSPQSKKVKSQNTATQGHIFHSVLKFLDISSPIYKEEKNIFK